ncbi:hypothetical protein VPH35_017717 [Triticum aestivum]
MTSYFSSLWHELVHNLLAHPKVSSCPEWLKGSTDIASSISRQKAKILSILLQLCESESISYLDEVATLPKSMQLGLEVLDLLKIAFGRKQKPAAGSHDKSYPMGSVLISALCLVDVFSDVSNFRSSFITNTIPFLTQILATPHDEFVSSWCSVDLPVMEDDTNLDYDPFGAADLALLAASNVLTEAKVNYSCNFCSISMPSIQYEQTRTSCVVKIIANLHVFVPNICEDQIFSQDLFLQKFQKYLLSESPKPSLDHPAADEITIVCTNLGTIKTNTLSHYAKSLIPGNLLNEEDAQLLRGSCSQHWCKSQVGQRISQVAKSDVTSEMKVDLQPVQQPQPTRAGVPDPNMDKDAPPKDVQNIEESLATPPMKQDGNARDEILRLQETVPLGTNAGVLQNSVGQNLIHLGVARTTSVGYPGPSTATSMEFPRCRSVDHFKTPEPSKESGLRSTTQDMMTSRPFTRSLSFEPGHPVLLIDKEGNEIDRGEIFQVEGRAQGKSLAESHICIIDVTELKVEKWREIPHPSEASGRTFQEAESRHGGVMRVAWDVVRLAPVATYVGWLVLFCGVWNVERSCRRPRLAGHRQGTNSK